MPRQATPSRSKTRTARFRDQCVRAAFAALLFAQTPVNAAIVIEELPPEQAFVIDKKVYGYKAWSSLVKGVRSNAPDSTDAGVTRGIVENHVMARAALKIIHNHEAHLAQRYRLWREYGSLLENMFPPSDLKALRAECVTLKDVSPAMLQTVIGAENKPGQMVRPGFTPIAKQYARQVTVATVACKDQPVRRVSFAEIIDVADEGEALRLWRGEPVAIDALRNVVIQFRLREAGIMRAGLASPLDIASLWSFVENKQTRVDLEQYMGVTFDIHHSPKRIQELKAEVTDQEIDAYYDKHSRDYQQILKVKARHITVDTQAKADEVVAKVKAGLSFDEAVRRYSMAPDKATNPRGELPEIDRRDPDLEFREKMALILPAGEVSPSFRMLDGKTYEIFWIDERVGEVLPKQDASVRNEIRGEIAHLRAGQEYIALRQKVWSEASITLNSRYFTREMTKGWGE